MYCKKCGSELREGAAFCPSCGAAVEDASHQEEPQEKTKSGKKEKPGKKKKGLWIAVSILLVIALLCGIGFPIYNNVAGYQRSVNRFVRFLNNRSTDEEQLEKILIADVIPSSNRKALQDLTTIIFSELYEGLDEEFGPDWEVEVSYSKVGEVPDPVLNQLSRCLQSSVASLSTYHQAAADLLEGALDEFDPSITNDSAIGLMGYFLYLVDLNDVASSLNATKGYRVKVNLMIRGSKDIDTDVVYVDFLKVGSKWIPIPLDGNDGNFEEMESETLDDLNEILDDLNEMLDDLNELLPD